GDNELAAHLHGAVSGARAALVANAPHEMVTTHNAMLARVERALGSQRFAAIRRRGEGVTWADAIEEALAYARSINAATAPTNVPAPAPVPHLTPRQRDVLLLLADGLRNKEIAAQLDLTPKTVTHHLSAIYQELGVRGRSEATAWALRTGFAE